MSDDDSNPDASDDDEAADLGDEPKAKAADEASEGEEVRSATAIVIQYRHSSYMAGSESIKLLKIGSGSIKAICSNQLYASRINTTHLHCSLTRTMHLRCSLTRTMIRIASQLPLTKL